MLKYTHTHTHTHLFTRKGVKGVASPLRVGRAD